MKALLILFLATVSVGLAQGQYITKHDGKLHYEVQGQDGIFNYTEMGSIFNTNEKAYSYYSKSLRNRKTAKRWGHITLGAMGAGALALAVNPRSDEYCDFICFTPGQAIFLITWVVITPITGTVSFSHKLGEMRKRKKAIKLMNGQPSTDFGYSEEVLELNTEIGVNGIGITLNF